MAGKGYKMTLIEWFLWLMQLSGVICTSICLVIGLFVLIFLINVLFRG